MMKMGILGILVWVSVVSADTFLVTSIADTGQGTLRSALLNSQQRTGADTIHFNLADSLRPEDNMFWQIWLRSPLPEIADDSTFISGFTQHAFAHHDSLHPLVQVNGDSCWHGPGFLITSSCNVLEGLAIGGFSGSGVLIKEKSAKYNKIRGCYVGLDALGNTRHRNGENGIDLRGGPSYNIIGDTTIVGRNIISGNGNYGIRIENANNNIIQNNFIGTDLSGMSALPNGDYPEQKNTSGIFIGIYSQSNRIGTGTEAGRNIISGNMRTGLRIEWSGADSNVVKGNYIGLGVDGEISIPNGEAGMVIGRGAKYNLIGGEKFSEANIISGNFSSGVQFARESFRNIFKGNYIGTNATGTNIVPNAHNGIYFYGTKSEGYPKENIIGPDNVICGNGMEDYNEWWWAGISMEFEGVEKNIIFGNYIGMNPTGSLHAGQPTGILLQSGVHDNTFGPNNIIVNSFIDGVLVLDPETVGNRFTENLIYNNQGLPIHNSNGGNTELTPPVFSNIDSSKIEGWAPPHSMVEFYSGLMGQAENYLGKTRSDSSGIFKWKGDVPEQFILALAIDSQGNTSQMASGFTTVKDKNQNMSSPKTYHMLSVHPNPFNSSTTISVRINSKDAVLSIYNILGRKVRSIRFNNLNAGQDKFVWDGKDDRGFDLPSGEYFISLQSDYNVLNRKCLLLR
jgi:hypothetical protein